MSGLLLWLGVTPRQGLWCRAELGVAITRSLMSDFCLTGVSLARLGRTLSVVLAVLLTDVRVCREVSGFIASQAEQIMLMHQNEVKIVCFLVANGSAVQCVAQELAVCRKVKASS